MRMVFFILLFGLVTFGALTGLPIVFDNPGYVMVSVGKSYVEMTLLTLVVAIVVIWGVLKFAIYVIARVMNVGSKTRFYFFNKSEQKAQLALRQGLTAYLLGDYKRAEKLLASAGKHSGLIESKHMFAAAAADATGDENKVIAHLNALDEDDNDTTLLKTRLLLNRDDTLGALELIEPLYKSKPKDDVVLAQYVDILQRIGDWQKLLSLLGLVEKRKLFDETQLPEFTAKVIANALFQTAREQTFEAAQKQFDQLPNKWKKQDGVAAAYVEFLLAHGKGEQAQTVLVKAIKKSSVKAFLPLLRKVRFDEVIELNKFIQAGLKKDENDQDLLAALAYIAVGRGDWQLVASVLSKTVGPDSKVSDIKTLAYAYGETGQHEKAVKLYQKM